MVNNIFLWELREIFVTQGCRDQGKVTKEVKPLLNSIVGGQVNGDQFGKKNGEQNIKQKRSEKMCAAG